MSPEGTQDGGRMPAIRSSDPAATPVGHPKKTQGEKTEYWPQMAQQPDSYIFQYAENC